MNDAPADVGPKRTTDTRSSSSESALQREARSWRGASYLKVFAIGLILPVLIFALALAWFYVDAEQNGAMDRARSAAREMAAAVDSSLSGPRLLLQALATSPALRAGDVRGFYESADETLTTLGDAITVTVPGERRPVVITSAPWGSELPELDAVSLAYQNRVAGSKMPAVSNLIQRDGSYFVTIYVPVLRESEPVYILSIDLPAAHFVATLSQVQLEHGWFAGLIDGNGRVIARTLEHMKFVGRQTPPEWSAKATGADGVWTGRNLDGTEVAAAYAQSPATGWTTAVTVPLSILNAPTRRASLVLLAVGGALLAFAIALASWIGSRLSRALSSLENAAVQLTSNADVTPVETPVEEINHVGKALSVAASEALRREAHLRSILATVPSAMVVIDSQGTIRSFSATAERLFGYRADEVAGSNVRVLMPEPDRSAHDGYIEHYLQTGERRIMGKGRVVTGLKKDGTRFPLELHVGEADVAGEKVFTGFMRDQTEKRRVEQELLQTQKMEAIGKLTGGVAHDFNNLLTVIKGNLEMLEAKLDGQYRELMADAQEAADLAAHLTASLLAFGRQMPLNPILSDAGRIVTATGDLLRRTLGETIEIKATIKMGCRTIVDAAQLQNALLNLGINARDAMPEGGTLTIEVSETELDEGYAATYPEVRPGRYALIVVGDTGVGMSPEVKERAFEPFFTTKPQGSGTGLGLSSVYGFVKQSGGHIALYSEEGRGTTIRIYLPMAGRDVADKDRQTRTEPPPAQGHGERILVVEDDDRVRRVTVARLQSLGYRVLEASNGRAALDLLAQETDIDLLFTDMAMPGGMSGAELALEVRRRKPALPVLFASGYTEMGMLKNIEITNDRWLTKPYTAADLAKRLELIFGKGQR